MGFISSDFREHAVNYQLFDFFSLLAKDDKFILDFFYNYHTNDHLTNKLKSQIKNWSNIFFQNDEDIFQNIKDKQLDFLIDLNGLSDGNRNAIFDNKPAPCLINWCGWLTSTFNKNFDYILGDSFVFSGSQKDDYFENALSMPRIWSTLSKSLIKNKPNKIKNIKNEKSVFICPQRYDKINEEVILCWKDIVNSDSTKELYLSNNCYADPFILQKILKKFKYYDCNINKIKFFYNNDRFRSLEIYKKADIALDTFPYSGGTTTFELLYLNIPVVTLKGNHFISNTSYSLNMNLELGHCVANSASDYTSKSIELSKNPKLYLDVQNQIIKKIHKDDVFSSSYFYKDFVSLFL
jgi:protein O-GlcNAc transferase